MNVRKQSFRISHVRVSRKVKGRGVATGGAGWGEHGTHFNFRTKKGSTVSSSKIRDIVFYECSEIIRTRNFTIFTIFPVHATIFGQFKAAFHFF